MFNLGVIAGIFICNVQVSAQGNSSTQTSVPNATASSSSIVSTTWTPAETNSYSQTTVSTTQTTVTPTTATVNLTSVESSPVVTTSSMLTTSGEATTSSLTTTGGNLTNLTFIGGNLTKPQIIGITVGSVVGFLIVAGILIGIIVYCCLRKRSQDDGHGKAMKKRNKSTPIPIASVKPFPLIPLKTDEPTAAADALPSKVISLKDLGKYIQDHGNSGLGDEFSSLPAGELHPCKQGRLANEKNKNRYVNILPYDMCRVTLTEVNQEDWSTYINASFINGYNRPKAFIATQGPTDDTTGDFWRMIWELHCPKIMMATNLVEKKKVKCSKYWPDSSEHYGKITVTLGKETKSPHFAIREFLLSMEGEPDRNVVQYHFTTWPDENVPDTGTDVIEYLQAARKDHQDCNLKGPTVVHCSAGVGRTGTLIAFYNELDRAKELKAVDIYQTVYQLRHQRINMIQSWVQYVFVYHMLLEAAECELVAVPVSEFNQADIEKQSSVFPEVSKEGQQFKVLDAYIPIHWDLLSHTAQLPANKERNRNERILPSEQVRTILLEMSDCDTEYINACTVVTYRNMINATYGVLVTQTPLPNTVREFWRFVLDYNCTVIVALDNMYNEQFYWPTTNEPLQIGPFTLTLTSCQNVTGSWQMSDIYVECDGREDENMTVRHVWLKWSTDSLPDPKLLLKLYMQVLKLHSKDTQTNVAVHCREGFELSGLFCGAHHIVEKIRQEDKVDVFNAVKHIRKNRPQFIPTLDQYRYLYKLAQVYINSAEQLSSVETTDVTHSDNHIYDNIVFVPERQNSHISSIMEDSASVHHLIIDID